MNEAEGNNIINIYNDVKAKGTFTYLRRLENFKKDKYYKFYLLLKSNRQVMSILKYNYSLLIKLVDFHCMPENHSKVWNAVNSSYRWKQQKSITIQLFNYLSSVFATVDFSRSKMRRNISSNPEISELSKKSIEEYFDKNPYHRFIQDLRNYTSHNSYMRIGTESSISSGLSVPRRNVYTLKEELMESSKWHALSKEFLNSQESKIYIIDIIKSHFPIFSKFQDWSYLALLQVDQDFTEEFRNELERLLVFAEKVNMARTSLPYNHSYIRYLDQIIKESKNRCSTQFNLSNSDTNS